MNFRPLYSTNSSFDANSVRVNGNMGLYFEKFADAWQWKKGFPTFDPPSETETTTRESWLDKVAAGVVGNRDLISEAANRLYELVQHRGGSLLCLVNESRFVSGTGIQHPTENGFAWHRTLGVPFLPGTGVKGMLCGYLDELTGGQLSETHLQILGKAGNVGEIGFTEVLPLAPVKLVVEVMTPHYGAYYSGGVLPGDWLSPVPITYLAVEKSQKWICGLFPTRGRKSQQLVTKTSRLLTSALIEVGAGAKTEVGFGRFALDNSTLLELQKRREALQKKLADELTKAEAMKGASDQLVSLMQRYERENWSKDIGWAKQSLEKYLKELETSRTPLNEDSVAWLRRTVVEVGRNVGAWENPHATQGKKNEPKYSKTMIELVERLKSFNQSISKP